MLPDGIIRTPMGIFVLRDDVSLSCIVARENRLDTNDNVVEIASFAHLIPNGGVVVDAGACLGDHVVSYSQIVGARGAVYAFEPHPLTYEALVLNVARLRNVATLRYGLSDISERAHFTSDPNVGASFVSDDGSIDIETVTLDGVLLPIVKRCDFIHLDAEGFELRILRGAQKLITKFHPLLLVEVCDKHLRRAGASETELLSILAEYGYVVTAIPTHIDPELHDVLCVWEGQ